MSSPGDELTIEVIKPLHRVVSVGYMQVEGNRLSFSRDEKCNGSQSSRTHKPRPVVSVPKLQKKGLPVLFKAIRDNNVKRFFRKLEKVDNNNLVNMKLKSGGNVLHYVCLVCRYVLEEEAADGFKEWLHEAHTRLNKGEHGNLAEMDLSSPILQALVLELEARSRQLLLILAFGRDQYGRTPAHYAAILGLSTQLFILLKSFPQLAVVHDDLGMTVLHYAAYYGHHNLCIVALSGGAVVDYLNNEGHSALDLARLRLQESVASLLVEQGAEISLNYEKGLSEGLKLIQSRKAEKEEDIARKRSSSRSVEHDTFLTIGTTSTGSKSLDDYGFEVDENDPDSIGMYKSAKVKRREGAQESKWDSIWDDEKMWAEVPMPKKVVSLVRKGIPASLRGRIWCKVAAHRMGDAYQVPDFNVLKGLVGRQGSVYTKQIDLDILRTARRHVRFSERYGFWQGALFTILRMYSQHNNKVGYTQGMSDLCANILIQMEDMWSGYALFFRLMDCYFMKESFSPDFKWVQMEMAILSQLVKELLPAVHSVLEAEGVTPFMYAFRWLLVLEFGLPYSLTIRVLDILFFEGPKVKFAAALSTLQYLEPHLKGGSADSLMNVFRCSSQTITDENQYISMVCSWLTHTFFNDQVDTLLAVKKAEYAGMKNAMV